MSVFSRRCCRRRGFNVLLHRRFSSAPSDPLLLRPRIKVIGIGGAGSNTVDNMIARSLEGVEFGVANTDAQALARSKCPVSRRLQLGRQLTRGLGAGAMPDVGRKATEETIEEAKNMLANTDMLFLTAGMGGGTGTGGAPVLAEAARSQGTLTVGIVTKPFDFEGKRRMKLANQGVVSLKDHVDTLIIVPNQRILSVGGQKQTFDQAFEMVNDVLYEGVKAVTDVIVKPGLINLDFADVRAITQGPSWGLMGTGTASGANRAMVAAQAALNNPLLGDVRQEHATGVLISICGGHDLGLLEVDEVVQMVHDTVSEDANIIFGATADASMDGKIQVSLILTGPWDETPELLTTDAERPKSQRRRMVESAKETTTNPEEGVEGTEGDAKKNKFWDSWF